MVKNPRLDVKTHALDMIREYVCMDIKLENGDNVRYIPIIHPGLKNLSNKDSLIVL